jgi:hypothetical protein
MLHTYVGTLSAWHARQAVKHMSRSRMKHNDHEQSWYDHWDREGILERSQLGTYNYSN